MARDLIAFDDRALPDVDLGQFKRALGSFATGVTLATTAVGSELHGVTANAVMSVSLEPPLVLLSIQQGTRMHTALQCSDNYALNILAADQEDLARYFADSAKSHGTAAFSRLSYHCGPTGAPLLADAIAHADCRIVEAYPAGDHTLYLGRVVHADARPDGRPLLYFRKRFMHGK